MARKTVRCPVCNEAFGVLVPDEVCSYVCHECRFVFTWNEKGKPLPPEKWNEKKASKGCGCVACQDRDANKKKKKD